MISSLRLIYLIPFFCQLLELCLRYFDKEISHLGSGYDIFKNACICNDQKPVFFFMDHGCRGEIRKPKSRTAVARNVEKLKSREVTVWRTTLPEY